MTLYFKHVDGADTAQVGYVGVQNGTKPSTFLRDYRTGDHVLLGVGKARGEVALRGNVFGRCTLLHLPGSARELGNPAKMEAKPLLAGRWPDAIAIREAWVLDRPVPYAHFNDVSKAVATRGRFAEIKCPERIAFFNALPWRQIDVFHSPAALRIIQRLAA